MSANLLVRHRSFGLARADAYRINRAIATSEPRQHTFDGNNPHLHRSPRLKMDSAKSGLDASSPPTAQDVQHHRQEVAR
jgi:hypothetical protein